LGFVTVVVGDSVEVGVVGVTVLPVGVVVVGVGVGVD
jgi:hypothetical protein